ncbi:MAG: DUF4157 domain-containing protein [Myxococcota bacterium]
MPTPTTERSSATPSTNSTATPSRASSGGPSAAGGALAGGAHVQMMRALAGGGIDVQLKALAPAEQDPGAVQQAAAEGVASGGGALPHGDKIQKAFGRHDVSHVRAHTGPAAAAASRAIGAEAYATGDRVAFGGEPDLHTAAHEAAHVIQQKQGVSLKGGVGASGDVYERQADAVADRVVQGKSAEDLLGAPAASGGGGGGAATQAVQKKAYLGPSYTPAPESKNEKVNDMRGDEKVRRFKDQAELDQYAGGATKGIGTLADGSWVRVEGPMLVLGENHGAPKAPDILKATKIAKFRYEGFTHHSATRKKASTPLADHLKGEDKKRHDKIGVGEVGPNEPAHAAEHALPKYTRVIPDAKALAQKQLGIDQKTIGEIKADDVKKGAPMGDAYSLSKALLESLLSAFIYARSYGGKFFSHELKAFYDDNQAAADKWIAALEVAIPEKKVPDFNELSIDVLDLMHTAYRTAAQKKVGLATAKAVEDFKGKLALRGEKDVAITAESKEDDYLRDKSMFDTIKAAKSAGDQLFIVGDAHRAKLQPLIEGLGLPAMTDTDFLDGQKKLDADAKAGVTTAERGAQADLKARAQGFGAKPMPQRVGDKFKLETKDIPDCQWVIKSGCEATGKPGEYVVTSKSGFAVELVWSKKGLSETLKTVSKTFVNDRPKPKGVSADSKKPEPKPLEDTKKPEVVADDRTV